MLALATGSQLGMQKTRSHGHCQTKSPSKKHLHTTWPKSCQQLTQTGAKGPAGVRLHSTGVRFGKIIEDIRGGGRGRSHNLFFFYYSQGSLFLKFFFYIFSIRNLIVFVCFLLSVLCTIFLLYFSLVIFLSLT